MIIIQFVLLVIILIVIEAKIFLYYTEDGPSVEFYDCLFHQTLIYCRRPEIPIVLRRENQIKKCDHDGIYHSFSELLSKNISVSTITYEWKSTLEMVGQYAYYVQAPNEKNNNYLCQCNMHLQSFGKYCEYVLPIGTTFSETVLGEMNMKKENQDQAQKDSDILCYTTLECNSGLLCLDWRDICDGVQQCMFGYDEENCDRLEFDECEWYEYRCMNGMCIPNEYFLDGEYDCMDLSDEKGTFDNGLCAFQEISLECDERICLPNYWSCGDGQCISDRLAFQKSSITLTTCMNRRDQYFMCETHSKLQMWTLPNGKCFSQDGGKEYIEENKIDPCVYFIKCALTQGGEEGCQCKLNDRYCYNEIENPCLNMSIQYPHGAIIAPYVNLLYKKSRNWLEYTPDLMQINATIKCRGYTVNYQKIQEYKDNFNLRQFELEACKSEKNRTILTNSGYHKHCHNNSRTFNNRSYNFIDVCHDSRECISTYRIQDGYMNCLDGYDEKSTKLSSNLCSINKHHRFRCSVNQSTCLYISSLGNFDIDCENRYDESWMGTDLTLSKLTCKKTSKDDCQLLRQYIETSWNNDGNFIDNMNSSKTIPFRSYCDSFWDFSSKKDEDSKLCQQWWICLENQWRCRSGQCIDPQWVLDEEWDCSDASDEEGLLILNNAFSPRNNKLIKSADIQTRFEGLYKKKPLMSICDYETEFPCYGINSSDPLYNINGTNRPCIKLEKLGDGHIDCLGAIDEQNSEDFCHRTTMLGRNFKCLTSDTCIPYLSICDVRCPNPVDDNIVCYGKERFPNCSDPYLDFTCFDGKCARQSWCDNIPKCTHGEDEYLCYTHNESPKKIIESIHRRSKEIHLDYKSQLFQLPRFPVQTNKTISINSSTTREFKNLISTDSLNISSSSVSYQCNRGIGIFTQNKSIVCFCPQQYYGDRCQYYNDRITLMFHMNFSQSIYTTTRDSTIFLKMLVLFTFEKKILSSYEFHARPSAEMTSYYKKIDHVVYSHSNQSLFHKRSRYFNRSNIINEHPYAVRIEAYDIKMNEKAELIAVWQYPIYFDFLPSYRFAKVLHLTQLQIIGNPCLSSPCGKHQICQQILNKKSDYICLCKENYSGTNCSQLDQTCMNGYCSTNALCKPMYRGLLNRNELPYCICPKNYYGFQCTLEQEQCNSNPCQNNGTCFQSATPDRYFCVCKTSYQGTNCEIERDVIRLNVNKSFEHDGAIIQYFSIDYSNLELELDYQRLFKQLPSSIFYRHEKKSKTSEIIVIKLYTKLQMSIHLISVYINASSFNATVEITDMNRCHHVNKLFQVHEDEISPFKYHYLCRNRTKLLLCFHDMNYLCICDENHIRAECFVYDHSSDRCSNCMASGRCIQGNRLRADDYLCICLPCHSGKFCQFSSESFSFTLDQLFSADLLSNHSIIRYTTMYLLIFGSSLMFLFGFVNNIFSFVTFRRPKCRRYGSGQYLLFMSIINQINLTVLILRLIHLIINIISRRFHPLVNIICCSVLNYLLKTSSRITYWLVALIAIERVYTTVFLNKRWLKKPYIARRLIIITTMCILVTGAYELAFVSSHSGFNDGKSAICILVFPQNSSIWMYLHQGVTIINALIPFLINLCSMITITYVVIKNKMLVSQGNIYSISNETKRTSTSMSNDTDKNIKVRFQTRFELLREVLHENKELVIGPAVTLVPQLFSLPLFIASLTLVCQTIETSSIRYLLIISYFTSFIPQLSSFFLYISPSSLYSNEWHATDLSKRLTKITQFRRSTPSTNSGSIIQTETKQHTK
ncbi:hypothetical protein I4U23_001498 [Adineta vaga]|nr:hypothetical protein I4U23_001498 [Adineta vaga]